MRTFTYLGGKLMRGLVFSETERGNGVVLGKDSGSKRIPLDLSVPAIVEDGIIYEAQLRKIEAKRDKRIFYVLKNPLRGSNSFLVRVNTAPISNATDEPLKRGSWRFFKGNAKLIETGNGLKDGARYSDDIVELGIGDSVLINPDIPDGSYAVINNRGVLMCVKRKLGKKCSDLDIELENLEPDGNVNIPSVSEIENSDTSNTPDVHNIEVVSV